MHRLIYDHLSPRWDKAFKFDAWSCRPGKGQHQAVKRAASFMDRYSNGWVWRADVEKFFDNVDQVKLFELIQRCAECPDTLWLIKKVLSSYCKDQPLRGMPIGNLTSQIFANLYMNEFDRYMAHTLKPGAYLRYGDDWLCLTSDKKKLIDIRQKSTLFLNNTLALNLSQKLNVITPTCKGVTYLGVDIWPGSKRLSNATKQRIARNIQSRNFASYEALMRQLSTTRTIKNFYWQTLDLDI